MPELFGAVGLTGVDDFDDFSLHSEAETEIKNQTQNHELSVALLSRSKYLCGRNLGMQKNQLFFSPTGSTSKVIVFGIRWNLGAGLHIQHILR